MRCSNEETKAKGSLMGFGISLPSPGDVVSHVADAVKGAANVASDATKALAKSPVMWALNPGVALGAASTTVVAGIAGSMIQQGWSGVSALVTANPLFTESRMLLDTTKALIEGKSVTKAIVDPVSQNIASNKTLLPYAQAAVSIAPGIGSGASSAIAMAIAISSGEPLDEVSIQAAIAALPGGALVQQVAHTAYNLAKDIVSGKIVKDTQAIVIREARARLRNDLERAAFDFVLALVMGKSIQDATIQAGTTAAHGSPLGEAAVKTGARILHGDSIDHAVLSEGSKYISAAVLASAKDRIPHEARDAFEQGTQVVDKVGQITKDGQAFLYKYRNQHGVAPSQVAAMNAGVSVAQKMMTTNAHMVELLKVTPVSIGHPIHRRLVAHAKAGKPIPPHINLPPKKVHKKSLWLGALGGGIGFLVGGPIGVAVGATAGAAVGHWWDRPHKIVLKGARPLVRKGPVPNVKH
jgi:hypothetical protein